jgi:hypothetical protein
MITEIPTQADFESAGVSLLNLAWDTVSSLYLYVERSEMEAWDDVSQGTDEFWKAAHQPLSNAQALLQQGVEFLLKGRIAAVSPFLLLDGAPREWPKGSNSKDIAYSEFRTIDAQDLVRVHDTMCSSRLDQSFVQRLDELRQTRNAFVHSIDKRLRHRPEELWIAILDVTHHLVGPLAWMPARRAYLQSTPRSVAFSSDESSAQLSWEGLHLLGVLKPAEQILYLGVAPKARWYICYNCSMECRDADIRPETAQLRPISSQSKVVYCFVCGEMDAVVRVPCTNAACKGNVVHGHDRVCLTCYCDQVS